MKQYKDYSNYTVQSDGIIISHYSNKPLNISKYKKNKQSNKVIYPRVRLSKNGKAKWYALHRIIAECYLDNPNNLPHVNHKDGDRLNNDVSNLEWCTHEQNIEHAILHNLNPKGERQGIALATEVIVRQIRELRKTKMSYKDISDIVGLKQRTVEAIGSGQNWKHVI